jgi:DNA-binding XRE family transcriptional regulator
MTHRIKSVKPLENFVISVVFQNGVEKKYDMRNLYPEFPQFRDFENDVYLFRQVKVDVGGYGVSWNDELDLDAEDIWENGTETNNKHAVDAIDFLATELIQARNNTRMTQKQLAEATGIYQADISKIERGISNPSVSTLQRLADGMNMSLKIEFVSK